jgi:hypothetical protein
LATSSSPGAPRCSRSAAEPVPTPPPPSRPRRVDVSRQASSSGTSPTPAWWQPCPAEFAGGLIRRLSRR